MGKNSMGGLFLYYRHGGDFIISHQYKSSIIRANVLAAANEVPMWVLLDEIIGKSMTGFSISLCGIFYCPWHRHQIEGTNRFSVSSERHRQSGVNEIAQVSKQQQVAWNPRTLSQQVAWNPGTLSQQVAWNPRTLNQQVAWNPRTLSQQVAWNPRTLSQQVAWNPRTLSQQVAWNPRTLSQQVAWNPRTLSQQAGFEIYCAVRHCVV